MLANPYLRYKQNSVETATPGKLILMLYDAAIRSLHQARAGVEEKDIEKANKNLLKVQDILTELMASLDFEQGEVAGSLYRLYEYMNHRLIQANLKKDTGMILEVENMLAELRKAWEVAVNAAR